VLGDEVVRVSPDRPRAVQLGGSPVAVAQAEPSAKRVPRDGVESLVERVRYWVRHRRAPRRAREQRQPMAVPKGPLSARLVQFLPLNTGVS
jgi:hypothetical protein